MATPTITKQLAAVQAELKAPKNQYNSFGKYHYRSAEDILEAAKPLCIKHSAVLTLSDEVIPCGSRVYIKATATITGTENGDSISAVAYAREPDIKKGMDDSQITGTASSYARKYALNGLFCIDDTKDADTNEHKVQTDGAPAKSCICTACGAEIKPIRGNDGKQYSAEDVQRINGGLCINCKKAMGGDKVDERGS